MDEAYGAIDWKTVFLLAGLIPLGLAMDKTGGARFVAEGLTRIMTGSHPYFILLMIAGLSTDSRFSCQTSPQRFPCPLAIRYREGVRLDPRALALLVGVSVANSFVLPTHQVTPCSYPRAVQERRLHQGGRHHDPDLFLVATTMVYFFYL